MQPEAGRHVDAVLAGQERCALVVADAVELLDGLPRGSVDLIFADPPYKLSNGGTTCRGGKRATVDKGAWDASEGLHADHAWHTRWLAAAQRALKPSGTIWVSGTQHVIYSLGWAMQTLGFHILNTVTWFKPNASPNLSCRFFTHSTELVIWAAPGRGKKLTHTFQYPRLRAANGDKQVRDAWEIEPDGEGALWDLPAASRGERREGSHPTQKPIALLDRIVTSSSSALDLVVDPFNGAGTSGVAALKHGRRYVGGDIDNAWLELTARRLRAAGVYPTTTGGSNG